LDYIGVIPDVSYYGASEMSDSERPEFLDWYECEKDKFFNNRRVLESYSQDDVTVLRQACQIFRREFMAIGKIEVFLEAITIASACNKVLRKRFLKPDTTGLIPTGGYSSNVNYSKKAIMWLIYKEQTDRFKLTHGRNGREYRLPEQPHLSVDGYCPEKKYKIVGCFCTVTRSYHYAKSKP
jgi:hypothetical protein